MIEGMQKHIVRGLMGGLFLLWLVFGILTWENSIVLSILLILNGVIFGFFAVVCKSRNRTLRWLLYIFIAVNIILTLTDQIGIYDWIVLVLYLALIGFLIAEDKAHKISK